MKFLSRLFPARLQTTPTPTNEERRAWLAGVGENDPMLKAALDIQQEILFREFLMVIQPNLADGELRAAANGLRVAYYALNQLEDERAAAKKWREARKQPPQ